MKNKPPALNIAKILLKQGLTEVEINRYLQAQGVKENEVIEIIRILNK